MYVLVKRRQVVTTIVVVVFDDLFPLLDSESAPFGFDTITVISLSFSLASVGNA